MQEESEGILSSQEQKNKLAALLQKRAQVLKDREESWRLRSRAVWLKAGDENTKFFHRHANGRKKINTIWELKKEDGTPVKTFRTFRGLAAPAKAHFQGIYKEPPIAGGHAYSSKFSQICGRGSRVGSNKGGDFGRGGSNPQMAKKG